MVKGDLVLHWSFVVGHIGYGSAEGRLSLEYKGMKRLGFYWPIPL
jgi:hypothetical protein